VPHRIRHALVVAPERRGQHDERPARGPTRRAPPVRAHSCYPTFQPRISPAVFPPHSLRLGDPPHSFAADKMFQLS